ncbi:DegT/DnrJ/EryC1/StrS aminotransferase family protein [Sphingorhabdus sp. IMCC26285]|uniref:DegT/DnrJ/EryC1/StrS aminotransferase family protein n=1 Tax=Sphingorhabdus profundilacus TaxID=2509718 RepID=A0A6I4M1W4_9SPHN|nr:DegT/DnrJ/EryC1/StrS aminotransferase family protein [Sphingorhabdus profundilacus]MVZ98254.1 DegT/DnrJ/EryC1/StrS aminotransferase family protein [Sphingorhabdus profundilacus]
MNKQTTPTSAEIRDYPVPIASSWPSHGRDEILAVTQVLQSGRVNALVHGEQNRAFEKEFAAYIGMPHAIAVSNGTVSIEMALRAFGIGAGDEVIIPARSFFATASAVVSVGASPVFADILVETQNIDPDSVARMISDKTKAVICVHLAGLPCDMRALTQLCDDHDLFLIEDCAQAHGAVYDGKMVGSFGDASSFSFCTDKIMSTGGEGGMILFADKSAWSKAWAIKDHGKVPPEEMPQNIAPPGEFRYVHQSFGTNFRMTEMQAAIGRVQLKKLPKWLAQRRANAHCLSEAVADIPGVIVDAYDAHILSARYKYFIRIDEDKLPGNKTRADIIAGLLALGIQCGSGSCPDMSKEIAFQGREPRRDGNLENAHRLGASTIMFPVDHLFSEDDMLVIAGALKKVVMA